MQSSVCRCHDVENIKSKYTLNKVVSKLSTGAVNLPMVGKGVTLDKPSSPQWVKSWTWHGQQKEAACLDCYWWCRASVSCELPLPRSVGHSDNLIRLMDSGSRREMFIGCFFFFGKERGRVLLLPGSRYGIFTTRDNMVLLLFSEVQQLVNCLNPCYW